MKNFLFEDNLAGGFFFVQCDTEEEAWDIVWNEVACEYTSEDYSTIVMERDLLPTYFNCVGYYSDAQAERMGYDTY